jgi:hypothetical protein
MSMANQCKSSQFKIKPSKFRQDQIQKDAGQKDQGPMLGTSKDLKYNWTHGAITIAKTGAKADLPPACGGEMGKFSRRLEVSAK